MQRQNNKVHTHIPICPSYSKVFLPFTMEMARITSSYLEQTVFVEIFGRPINIDEVSILLAHRAEKSGLMDNSKVIGKKILRLLPRDPNGLLPYGRGTHPRKWLLSCCKPLESI